MALEKRIAARFVGARFVGAWFVGACVGLGLCAAQTPPSAVSPNIADFQKRVADYMKVHNQAAAAIPGLKSTDSFDKIDSHEHDLQAGIRAARPNAAQGAIFTPPIAAEFHQIIRKALSGPGASHAIKGLHDTQPSPPPTVAVDADYPSQQPVAFMPPSLLNALPPLPKGLEYRAVRRTLILRDTEANLIVDYIHDALP